jgi:hypothetical protein
MFLGAVKAVLLIIGIIFLAVAIFILADYYGLVRKIQSWWADVMCYFSDVLSSQEFSNLGPLIAAIILALIGIICVRIALSIQRKAQQ